MTTAKMGDLAEPFLGRAQAVAQRIMADGLPMLVFETRRSFKRQQGLFMLGRTVTNGLTIVVDRSKVITNARPGESPHQWGLAADFVLDVRHPRWAAEKRKASGPWDTEDSLAKHCWARLGEIAKECDLAWGGNFKFKDMPHVELLQWKLLRPVNWPEIVQRELAREG